MYAMVRRDEGIDMVRSEGVTPNEAHALT